MDCGNAMAMQSSISRLSCAAGSIKGKHFGVSVSMHPSESGAVMSRLREAG